MTWFRLYRRNSRAPRDFMGRMDAEDAEQAKVRWIEAARSPLEPKHLDAVPAHAKPGK